MEAGAKLEEPSATHSDEAHAADDVVCLHSAAYHGDAAAAARYVAEARGDADLAQASKDAWHGGTPMCYAAMRGHAGVVDVLVEAGASQSAAMDGELRGWAEALSRGRGGGMWWPVAHVPRRERTGFTPLMLAAQRGHVDVCKKLLAAGADVNAVDANDGGTAAVWAAAEGHVDVLKVRDDAAAGLA